MLREGRPEGRGQASAGTVVCQGLTHYCSEEKRHLSTTPQHPARECSLGLEATPWQAPPASWRLLLAPGRKLTGLPGFVLFCFVYF